ncbi:acyl-CoA dehydrogenase, partial [Parvibaculum sp.]|uniref:acyl-CoA dehydrogenase family protein n=1 Tax=Parvibaculum sp. TaxID=2024848 RepID=UPI002C494D98
IHGGLDLGMVELAVLQEEIGRTLFPSPFEATVCLAANALLASADEGQKQKILRVIAAGELTATLAWSEPGGGFDPAACETRYLRDGDSYRLDGVKRHVVDGDRADLLLVTARGERGVSLFAVAADAPGLRRTWLPTMDQTRRQAEIVFENVALGADALVGIEGEALPPVRIALDRASILVAAAQVGSAERCLDMTVAYAKERVQFGRSIASFQAVKHTCADMLLQVESARSAAYYAACIADDGATGDELARAASLAKATCSDAYFACAGDAIQLHGGVGFTWEFDVHLYFKNAHATEKYLGTPAWHRERVARLMGLDEEAA